MSILTDQTACSVDKSLRILCISEYLPKPDRAAGDRRWIAMLKSLAKQHSVHYFAPTLYDTDPEVGRYCIMLSETGVILLPHVWRGLEIALAQHLYDVVIFEYWYNAEWSLPIVKQWQPWSTTIIDSVDVHFAREESGLQLGILTAEEVAHRKERELYNYRQVDGVIAITEEDRQTLLKEQIANVPPPVPLIIPERARPRQSRGKEVLFIGGFIHPPNVDGLGWFVTEIWPLIRRMVPDAVFTVVGSTPTPDIIALTNVEGIEFVGYVPDTGMHLDRASISVAPLRYGAGMKGKVAEAMAAGLPVVTTSVGVQGLQLTSGHDVLVADTAIEFSNAVVSLLREPMSAELMGNYAQMRIASICGPDVVKQRLDAALTAIIVPRSVNLLSWRLRSALFCVVASIRAAFANMGLRKLRARLANSRVDRDNN